MRSDLLATKVLTRRSERLPLVDLLKAVRDRYLRLVVPSAGTLLLAVLYAAWARQWMEHASIPDAASARQVLAHLLLLQDLLGIPALSAGVWYVATDLQLFVLVPSLLWLGAVLVALLRFNHVPSWDSAAPYFLGSHGPGVLAAWHGVPALRPHARLLARCAFGGVLLAPWPEFGSRLAPAAVLGCVLAFAGTAATSLFYRWIERPGLAGLGRQRRAALRLAPAATP